MRLSWALALLAATGSSVASAIECNAIPEREKRLDCYDQRFGSPDAPAPSATFPLAMVPRAAPATATSDVVEAATASEMKFLQRYRKKRGKFD